MTPPTDDGAATAKSGSKARTDYDFAEFLEGFQQTLDDAAERLLKIPEQQSDVPRAEDKWSPKQIIGHLIDSACNNQRRFVIAQFSDDLTFPGYEQESWVRVQNYPAKDWQELVRFWKLYNQHISHLMSFVPAETRLKPRYKHNLHEIASENLSPNEPVTLDWFMRDYVDHLKKHLQQILG